MLDEYKSTYYKEDGVVLYRLDIHGDDLEEIIDEYLTSHAEFEFEEMELKNNRPMNIWLTARCRKYVDPDDDEALHDFRVNIRRLRSVLRAYAPVLGDTVGKKWRRRLGAIVSLRWTGPNRSNPVRRFALSSATTKGCR